MKTLSFSRFDWKGKSSNQILIHKTNSKGESDCSSDVGMMGGKQRLTLGKNCLQDGNYFLKELLAVYV